MTFEHEPLEEQAPKTEAEVLSYIESLAQETWFASGEILVEDYKYLYLIEGWEGICLAEHVMDEVDWDDDDYFRDLVGSLHERIIEEDFLSKYADAEVVLETIADGAAYGVSIIVVKVPVCSTSGSSSSSASR